MTRRDQTEPAQAGAAAHPDEAGGSSPGDRSGYLAFVAHEMRNPLATALWSAELLAKLSPEDRAGARGDKLAGMCLRTLARLRHLVEDHFLVERLAINGLPVRFEPVPLGEALSVAAGRVPGLQWQASIATGQMVIADRAMLERALEALLAAAARDSTPVVVVASLREGMVELRFRGAPPSADAFRTPDRSTPSDPTGRALSLRMAAAVSHAHGGTLASSEGDFILAIPAESGEDR